MAKKDKTRAASIILDLSLKNALERRGQMGATQDVVLPWWFKRRVSVERSKEAMDAAVWLMNWLYNNAPIEAENVYCEADDSQNIVINPMIVLNKQVQEAFFDAGFKLMTEDDMPSQDKTDVWDRIKGGSNFSDKWH